MMKWVEASALILQFIAFWLAAPELLGEKTLHRFEERLHKFISNLPVYIAGFIGISAGLSLSALATYHGWLMSEYGSGVEINPFLMLVTSIIVVIAMLNIILHKRVRLWMSQRVARPMLQALIHHDKIRRQSLVMGAILFTIGFVLQLLMILIK